MYILLYNVAKKNDTAYETTERQTTIVQLLNNLKSFFKSFLCHFLFIILPPISKSTFSNPKFNKHENYS